MIEHIEKHRFLQNQYSDLNHVINDVVHSLLVERDGKSYVEFLVDEGYLTFDAIKDIQNNKNVQSLLSNQNKAYLNHLLEKLNAGVS